MHIPWGDPKDRKPGTCKACHGRGIVHNEKTGRAEVCPLCAGSGNERFPKVKEPEWKWKTI